MINSIDIIISIVLYGFSLSFSESEGLLALKEFYLYMTIIAVAYAFVDIFQHEKLQFEKLLQKKKKKEIFSENLIKGLVGGIACVLLLLLMGVLFPKSIHELNMRNETILANIFLIVPNENIVFFGAIPDLWTYGLMRFKGTDPYYRDIRAGSYMLSAVLFGMYHLVMSSFSIIYVMYGIGAGIIFVFVRERFNLWAARWGHTINNVLFYLLI